MSTSETHKRKGPHAARGTVSARRASASARATHALGARLARLLPDGAVVGLSGPLGAGKTVFVQGVAEGLGVPRGARVTSPTFVLLQLYAGRRLRLQHFDAYRLRGAAELVELGALDLLGAEGTVSVVEWSDRVAGALPAARLELDIAIASPKKRLLSLAAFGADEALARAVRAWGRPRPAAPPRGEPREGEGRGAPEAEA
jgi:tRNA threonylcarbamoyladenosine biosynthesis protein TsaE